MPQPVFSFRQVPPAAINDDKRWNLHPWAEELSFDLEQSLLNSGILNPPTLLPGNREGSFIILAGRRRIFFWKKVFGDRELLCKCFHSSPSPRQSLAIALDDQKFGSESLTLAEKAQFIRLAAEVSSAEKKELLELLPLLDLKKNPELLRNLQKLAEESPDILYSAHKGELSLQIYTELQKLNTKDRPALLELFSLLQLGSGKQRRFLLQLRDCAYARRQGIAEFLQQEEIQRILSESRLNIPQKIQHLGTLLQTLLQPSLYREEQIFKEQVQQLALPENYSIKHSPAFEKDEITLEITFKDLAHCKKYLAKNRF